MFGNAVEKGGLEQTRARLKRTIANINKWTVSYTKYGILNNNTVL